MVFGGGWVAAEGTGALARGVVVTGERVARRGTAGAEAEVPVRAIFISFCALIWWRFSWNIEFIDG